MPVIGSYILPHGAISLAPGKYPEYTDLPDLHKACATVGEEIYFMKPDLIFLCTPHGISLMETYGIYLNSTASGTAEWHGEWKEYKASIQIAGEESQDIIKLCNENNIKSEGIVTFSVSEPLPLRWGETIPLWFLQQPYNNYTMTPEKFPECIIMSMPRKRLTEPEQMIPECESIGNLLCEYFSKSKKKVVLIFSGDLSHIHKVSPKLSNTSTEIDEAEKFDNMLANWATDPIQNEDSLLSCGPLNLKFLSCGYNEFVMLNGLLKTIKKNGVEIQSDVLHISHPTYYGMMVARFIFKANN